MGYSDGEHSDASSVSPSWRVVVLWLFSSQLPKKQHGHLLRWVSLFYFFLVLVVSILSSLEKRIA